MGGFSASATSSAAIRSASIRSHHAHAGRRRRQLLESLLLYVDARAVRHVCGHPADVAVVETHAAVRGSGADRGGQRSARVQRDLPLATVEVLENVRERGGG